MKALGWVSRGAGVGCVDEHGTMRRFLRAFLVPVVVLAGSLGGPSAASAATQVGETFPGATGSCDTGTALQSSSPGSPPQYAASSAGVITAWSFHATPIAPTLLKLKVARPAGGNAFTIVGESPPKSPAGDVLSTYTDVRIAVDPGDVIGFYSESASDDAECFRSAPGFDFHYGLDLPPGSTADYIPAALSSQMSMSARLEPDADSDGFGDETQDQCPGQAGANGGCPPGLAPPPGDGSPDDGSPPPDGQPSNDISFGKVKRNKRKGTARLTVKVPGAGELELAKTKKVKADDESAEDAGKEKLSIKPKGKAKKKLNRKGKAKVKAKVTYTPDGGTPSTEDKKIKLVKR